jgi:hypothetical protein
MCISSGRAVVSCALPTVRLYLTEKVSRHNKGCQMVYLRTKNYSLGIFLEGLGMKDFGMFSDTFGIFSDTLGMFSYNLVFT